MLIRDAMIYDETFRPHKGDLRILNGRIDAVGALSPAPGEEIVDADRLRLVPGLIDIHIHGCMGREVSDADPDSIAAISRSLARAGTTSFCPTTMTVPEDHLARCFEAVAAVKGREPGAYIHGLHMEGPYLSQAQRGAQDSRYIRLPSLDEFHRLRAISPVALIGIAPEMPGALDFAREAARHCRVSMVHTDATYEQARAGLANGITHASHLFCAMSGLHHRAPGAVGAALDDPDCTAELICDGVHVHPPVLRLAFKLLGERAVAVTDAVAPAGLPEGEYSINGTDFLRAMGACFLHGGEALAGGAASLLGNFRKLLSFGIDEELALRAVTINPARVIGAQAFTGSIAPGKSADLLLADEDWKPRAVWVKGVLQEDLHGIIPDWNE